jgi:hypothetical protein
MCAHACLLARSIDACALGRNVHTDGVRVRMNDSAACMKATTSRAAVVCEQHAGEHLLASNNKLLNMASGAIAGMHDAHPTHERD